MEISSSANLHRLAVSCCCSSGSLEELVLLGPSCSDRLSRKGRMTSSTTAVGEEAREERSLDRRAVRKEGSERVE